MTVRRGGFVLVAALWLLVALGAVGLDAALRSRTRRLAAANLLDETRARAAALAGTEYARSRLTAAMLDRAQELRSQAQRTATTARAQTQARNRSMSQLFRSNPADDPWRMPDQLIMPSMAFGDAQYALRVRDTGAALNLNGATEQMLRDFFARGLRVDAAAADHLAQAILDWRDEDENPRINGGERDQYLDENAIVLPPNRDFADLEELRHVMGMTPELYEAVLPYLTLVGSGDINLNAAPEPVLMALPGLTDAGVTQLVRLRESGQFPRNAEELQAALGSLARGVDTETFEDVTTYSTNEVEIISEGAVAGSPMRVRARVVVTRSNSGAVVVWRRID